MQQIFPRAVPDAMLTTSKIRFTLKEKPILVPYLHSLTGHLALSPTLLQKIGRQNSHTVSPYHLYLAALPQPTCCHLEMPLKNVSEELLRARFGLESLVWAYVHVKDAKTQGNLSALTTWLVIDWKSINREPASRLSDWLSKGCSFNGIKVGFLKDYYNSYYFGLISTCWILISTDPATHFVTLPLAC